MSSRPFSLLLPLCFVSALALNAYAALDPTGASAVILSPIASREQPRYRGEEEVCREENTDLRIFGKPSTKLNRRMGVVVRYDALDADLDALRDKTKAAAAKVEVY